MNHDAHIETTHHAAAENAATLWRSAEHAATFEECPTYAAELVREAAPWDDLRRACRDALLADYVPA